MARAIALSVLLVGCGESPTEPSALQDGTYTGSIAPFALTRVTQHLAGSTTPGVTCTYAGQRSGTLSAAVSNSTSTPTVTLTLALAPTTFPPGTGSNGTTCQGGLSTIAPGTFSGPITNGTFLVAVGSSNSTISGTVTREAITGTYTANAQSGTQGVTQVLETGVGTYTIARVP